MSVGGDNRMGHLASCSQVKTVETILNLLKWTPTPTADVPQETSRETQSQP